MISQWDPHPQPLDESRSITPGLNRAKEPLTWLCFFLLLIGGLGGGYDGVLVKLRNCQRAGSPGCWKTSHSKRLPSSLAHGPLLDGRPSSTPMDTACCRVSGLVFRAWEELRSSSWKIEASKAQLITSSKY